MIKVPEREGTGKGAYSAIVYKDGDLIVAEDNLGSLIGEDSDAATVIQTALDTKTGKTLCLNGEYEISTAISMPSNRILEGESRKTIFAEPATPLSEMIKNDYVNGASDFQIRSLSFDGKSRGVDWKHAIWLQNVSRFTIENISGFDLTGTSAGSRNNLITIGAENTADRIGLYGTINNITANNVEGDIIYITGRENQLAFSDYFNINNILSIEGGGSVIDLNEVRYSNISNITSYTTACDSVLTDGIHYCNFENIAVCQPNFGLLIGHHAAGKTGFSSHNHFNNITCYHPLSGGIKIINSSFNTVSNFQIIGNAETAHGVHVHAVGAGTTDEGVAKGNKFVNGVIMSPKNTGVYVQEGTASDNASSNSFENVYINKIAGTSTHGFYTNGKYTSFVNCRTIGGNISDGFNITSGANNCNLVGCIVYDADNKGFELHGNNTKVIGCDATHCDDCGFWNVGGRNVLGSCIANDNGQDGNASYKDGFSFQGTSSYYSVLSGCVATGNAAFGARGHYSADYLLLIGNALTGNTSGSTSNLGVNSKAPTDSNFL